MEGVVVLRNQSEVKLQTGGWGLGVGVGGWGGVGGGQKAAQRKQAGRSSTCARTTCRRRGWGERRGPGTPPAPDAKPDDAGHRRHRQEGGVVQVGLRQPAPQLPGARHDERNEGQAEQVVVKHLHRSASGACGVGGWEGGRCRDQSAGSESPAGCSTRLGGCPDQASPAWLARDLWGLAGLAKPAWALPRQGLALLRGPIQLQAGHTSRTGNPMASTLPPLLPARRPPAHPPC